MVFQTRQKGLAARELNGIHGDVDIISSDSSIGIVTDVENGTIDLSNGTPIDQVFTFSFASTFPVHLGLFNANARIKAVDLFIRDAWDVGVQFSVGTLIDPELFVPKSYVDSEISNAAFSTEKFYKFLSATDVYLFIYGTPPTLGSGEVYLDVI